MLDEYFFFMIFIQASSKLLQFGNKVMLIAIEMPFKGS